MFCANYFSGAFCIVASDHRRLCQGMNKLSEICHAEKRTVFIVILFYGLLQTYMKMCFLPAEPSDLGCISEVEAVRI